MGDSRNLGSSGLAVLFLCSG
uniref:Uncharacterized protein n=1 Tax=Anguilla anguilla TaxID=7936 RepID=A0A0E9Q4C8_ANGAN